MKHKPIPFLLSFSYSIAMDISPACYEFTLPSAAEIHDLFLTSHLEKESPHSTTVTNLIHGNANYTVLGFWENNDWLKDLNSSKSDSSEEEKTYCVPIHTTKILPHHLWETAHATYLNSTIQYLISKETHQHTILGFYISDKSYFFDSVPAPTPGIIMIMGTPLDRNHSSLKRSEYALENTKTKNLSGKNLHLDSLTYFFTPLHI